MAESSAVEVGSGGAVNENEGLNVHDGGEFEFYFPIIYIQVHFHPLLSPYTIEIYFEEFP